MNSYTFMNKNAELFDIVMERGQAEAVTNRREDNLHLLPVFLTPKKNMGISRALFNEWWSGRRIPASRQGVKELLWQLREDDIHLNELAEKSFGLSLSDQYWLRPSEDITWSAVNFFENSFSEDIGRLLISGDWNGGSFMSPDNTTDGVVKKKWKIIDNVRCLVKGSFGEPWHAQPFRELFASKIAELLFKPFGDGYVVPYSLLKEDEFVYSCCPNFIDTNTEYVSFNQILQANKKPNNVSYYKFCQEFCTGFEFVIDLILLLDYIVLNEDRHYGNFGLIRDANNGELIRPAPAFDTGSSLFFDSTPNINRIQSKPFNVEFDKQIRLVDKSLYYDSLTLVRQNYERIFCEVFDNSFEDETRRQRLLNYVKSQIDKLFNSSSV